MLRKYDESNLLLDLTHRVKLLYDEFDDEFATRARRVCDGWRCLRHRSTIGLDLLCAVDDSKPRTWGEERTQLEDLWNSVRDDDEELLLFFPGGEDEFKCRMVSQACMAPSTSDLLISFLRSCRLQRK